MADLDLDLVTVGPDDGVIRDELSRRRVEGHVEINDEVSGLRMVSVSEHACHLRAVDGVREHIGGLSERAAAVGGHGHIDGAGARGADRRDGGRADDRDVRRRIQSEVDSGRGGLAEAGPLIVTEVPPLGEPDCGLIAVTLGATAPGTT